MGRGIEYESGQEGAHGGSVWGSKGQARQARALTVVKTFLGL